MSNKKESIITLGTFDGVHVGHQKIISKLLSDAKKYDLEPIVVTFFPHPTHVLTPDAPLKMINSIDERVSLLKKQGVDTVIVKEFTEEFSKKSALEFIEHELLGNLNMKRLIVGYDHSFGKDKEGDYDSLLAYSKKLGFDIEKVDALKLNDNVVSSSLIRDNLLKGEVENVAKLLGYNFCLYGKVVKGNQLGRKIGFNTANIDLDYPNKIVPKRGVYIVRSIIDDELYYGMMNIGYRPTIDGTTRTIEVHYFGLDTNLYDKNIKVYLIKRLRDELKFKDVEALKEQLILDKKTTMEFLTHNVSHGKD